MSFFIKSCCLAGLILFTERKLFLDNTLLTFKNRIKKEIKKVFERAENFREIKWLAIRLVDEDYEVEDMAKYAVEQGYASRLGYLAEICLEVVRKCGLRERESKLKELIERLYPYRNLDYEFLFHYRGKEEEKLKKVVQKKSNSELNKK